jgi:hypothetical protein
MVEVEWMEQWVAQNPEGDWIEFLIAKGASTRKFRLHCCASCRLVWDLLTYDHAREAVEVSERFADGLATEAEREAAEIALYRSERLGNNEEVSAPARLASIAALNAVWLDPRGNSDPAHGAHDVQGLVHRSLSSTEGWERRREAVDKSIIWLWGDIFGVLFGAARRVDSAWLSWNDGAVRKLAQTAYDDRQLPAGILDPSRLAVLADALEDAGCTDRAILVHLRRPGPHVRGCGPVDLLTGRS